MLKTFYPGGVHPPQTKFTASMPIVAVDLPRSVTLTLNQHIGAPAVPVVKVGDKVRRGDKVAEAQSYMSVPVHTPITGTVKSVASSIDGAGKVVQSVVVEATESDYSTDTNAERPAMRPSALIRALTPDNIRDLAKDAGLVGLGGATFPTHVKLTPPRDVVIDTLVVNGAECEPYLTCDDALMRESASHIMLGISLAMRTVGAEQGLVGIESNKPEAIKAMRKAAKEYADIKVVELATKYPQGGEKQLIYALTGRTVPAGALPAAVGCVVMNVATVYSLCRAACFGEPLMERVVTLTGDAVSGGGNFRVPIGFKLSELLEVVGLDSDFSSVVGKVIAGGPMMGKSLDNLDAPMRKGTSGIVLLSKEYAHRKRVDPCVRCARCVEVCPMGLEPYLLSRLSSLRRFDEAVDEGVQNCIECGSCQYVCPSARPLLDYIRSGKSAARMQVKKK